MYSSTKSNQKIICQLYKRELEIQTQKLATTLLCIRKKKTNPFLVNQYTAFHFPSFSKALSLFNILKIIRIALHMQLYAAPNYMRDNSIHPS